MKEKKYKILKIILAILLILLLTFIVIKIIPYFVKIGTAEGREEIKIKIKDFGLQGVFIIIGLMVAQVFFLFIPGEPVEVLAGMCYGGIGGLIVIFIGAFISSCLIFFLIRKLGRNFLYTFVEKEKIEKLENNKIFRSKNLDAILLILFALPGTPKDLLVYVGAFLPIKPLKFILISTLARFPSVITSTIAGDSMLNGNWKLAITMYLITFAIVTIATIFFYKDKGKNVYKI